MSLSSLLRILLARWWITAGLVVFCVGVISVVSMFMPRKYAASTELIMEGRLQDRVTGESVSERSGYMATQTEIIGSRRVAGRVYEYLPADIRKLVDERAAEHQEKGKVNPAGWLSAYVRRNLTVEPGQNSSVMTISFTADHPEVAAGVLNSLIGAYIDTGIELRTDPARRFSKWYQDQLDVLRANLRAAREDLSGFQKEHGIVGMNEQLDLENARLAELSSLLVGAADESTQDQLREGEGDEALAIPNNTAIQSLRSELARAQAELENMSTRYGERHPEYQRQNSEVQALRQSLARERRIAARSLESTADVSESRLKELQQAFDKQKQRVLSLKAKRDELELLQQEVQMAQEAYNTVSGRAQSNTLESRLAETSVTVLNEAVPPSRATSPNIKLNLVIATVLGFLLGVALSLLLELANRRVRSRSDIEEFLGIPVLAYLPDTAGTYRQREARTV